jgi:hypothetical protein
MDTGNRFERDPRSDTQQAQAYRDDTGVPTQGQGDERLGKFVSRCTAHYFLLFHCAITGQVNHVFLDDTERSGNQYAQQARYGQTGLGSTGQQRADDWGQGRAGADTFRTSEPSSTSAQYGSSESTARGQTGGYSDPSTGGNWQGERDDDGTGTGGGKPTVISKAKGTSSSLWCYVGAR